MFNSEKCCERRKWYLKKLFFYFFFLIVHISTNTALGGLILSMLVSNIHVEGTVSQIFVLHNTFYFHAKKRETLCYFSLNIHSKFYRN